MRGAVERTCALAHRCAACLAGTAMGCRSPTEHCLPPTRSTVCCLLEGSLVEREEDLERDVAAVVVRGVPPRVPPAQRAGRQAWECESVSRAVVAGPLLAESSAISPRSLHASAGCCPWHELPRRLPAAKARQHTFHVHARCIAGAASTLLAAPPPPPPLTAP